MIFACSFVCSFACNFVCRNEKLQTKTFTRTKCFLEYAAHDRHWEVVNEQDPKE